MIASVLSISNPTYIWNSRFAAETLHECAGIQPLLLGGEREDGCLLHTPRVGVEETQSQTSTDSHGR